MDGISNMPTITIYSLLIERFIKDNNIIELTRKGDCGVYFDRITLCTDGRLKIYTKENNNVSDKFLYDSNYNYAKCLYELEKDLCLLKTSGETINFNFKFLK